MKFIKHYVKPMDESLIQKCVFCEEVILDERNSKIPKEQKLKNAFREGPVFVSETSPKIYSLEIWENDQFINCSIGQEGVREEKLMTNKKI